MRDILFRGKRVDNGEWICGNLYQCEEDSEGYVRNLITPKSRNGSPYMVDDKTVGQYTGLIDKNGTRIFEGDILRFGKRNLMVWWNAESFQWQAKGVYGYDVITKENWLDNDWTNIDLGWIASEVACVGKMTTEIIGNIHDNTDMLTDKGEG